MAKELPYFRFTVSEWLNGDISMASYEEKGLFIDICSWYWFKDCNVTQAMLKQRYSNATALKKLYELDVIMLDSEKVTIEFLDEQFSLLSTKRKLRQKAGRKGGKQRSSNAKAMLKQSSSYKDKDKDKDKDKEIYKENEIEEIYKEYPSRCVVTGRSLSKSSKDKDRLKTILKTHTKESILSIIQMYINECKRDNTYMKNFSTFLNNLPDYGDGNTYQERRIQLPPDLDPTTPKGRDYEKRQQK